MTFPLFLIKLYSDFTIFVVCPRLSDSGDDALVEEITRASPPPRLSYKTCMLYSVLAVLDMLFMDTLNSRSKISQPIKAEKNFYQMSN